MTAAADVRDAGPWLALITSPGGPCRDGPAADRPALRHQNLAPKPGFRDRRHCHARPRHRRELHDLQRGQCHPPPPAVVPRRGSADDGLESEHPGPERHQHHLDAELQGVAAAQPVVRLARDLRLGRPWLQLDRHRRARAGVGRAGDGELLRRARGAAAVRPHVPARRRGARHESRRRPELRPLDAQLRRRSIDRRQANPDRRRPVYRRRRHARELPFSVLERSARAVGACQLDGRRPGSGIEFIHLHRPPEARRDTGAGPQ